MKSRKYIYMHPRMTDYQAKKLKEFADSLGVSVSKALNMLIAELRNFVGRDFDLKIDYSEHLSVLDKVDGDEERIVSPHLSITRENHLFLRNVKNRNFRVSFALLFRLLVEELLIKGKKVDVNHSPFFYNVFVLLTPQLQIIAPIPEEIRHLLL